MGPPPDPLTALVSSLLELQGSRLPPLELAELLWLAPSLPSEEAALASPPPQPPPPKRPPSLEPRPGTPAQPPSNFQPSAAPAAVDPFLPGFFPAAPPQPLRPAAAGLLPDPVLPTAADERALLLPLQLPDVPLIPEGEALQETLRPLAAAPSPWAEPPPRRLLAEVATVEAYARTQRLWPIYDHPPEPRLSLVLLVDGGLSMQVWQRLSEELLSLLTQSAGFRDVRQVRLEPPDPGDSRDSAALAAALAALGGDGEEQVVLLLSDCSGRHWWQGGAFHQLLLQLSTQKPFAIVQVLPDWLWRRTALGIGSLVAVRHPQPLAANRQYERWALQRWERRPPQGDDHFVVPLLTLERRSLATWRQLLLGQGGATLPAACLPARWPTIHLASEAAATPNNPAAREERLQQRLRKFLQRCSGAAERLLRVLAAAPVLTLPVMRMLQRSMVPEGGPATLAELLLSGFLQRAEGNGSAVPPARWDRRQEDRLQFSLDPVVRDALLKTLSGPATAEVVQKVSEWIEVCWDRCPNVPPFQAYLRDPSLLEESHPLASTAAFGQLTAEIIGRLPGPAYQQLAQKLRQGAAAPPPDPFPAASFRFEEIVVESATLQRLPGAEEELVYTTAQEQTAWLTECLYETAQLEAGIPVLSPARSWAYQEPLGPAAVFLEMLAIPPGRFTMGSPEGEPERFADEGPQREVELSAFFLSRTPITQAQWRAVAQWQPLEEEDPWPMELDPDPVSGVSEAMGFQGDQRPVVNVSWRQAMAFCQRLRVRTGKHYTLPSEAQWEYACRAGTTTPFHFGATLSTKLANYDGNYAYADGQRGEYRRQTTEVARFPANAWGLHDMHGNVWEWCLDHWHNDYKEAPCDGSAWLDSAGSKSEAGESEASEMDTEDNKWRLLRGGSWYFHPKVCRSAYRDGNHPDDRDRNVGFRLCCLPQDLFLYT